MKIILLLSVLIVAGCATSGTPHAYQDCRLEYFDRELNAHHSLEHVVEDSDIVCKRYQE